MRIAVRRTGRWVSVTALLLTAIMTVGAVMLLLYSAANANELPPYEATAWLFFFIPVSAFAAVGLAILRKDSKQPIGWIATFLGAGGAVIILAEVYALYELPGRDWLFWPAAVQEMPLWALFALMLLLFPTGRVPSHGWRPFTAFVVVFAISVTAVGAVAPWEYEPSLADYTATNPIGLPGERWPYDRLQSISFLGTLFVLVAAGSLVGRWRRATGDERLQLKWLGQAGAVLAIAAAVIGTNELVLGGQHGPDSAASLLIGNGLIWTTIASLPVAIGLAVTRYRLYEVDRIISRTVAYAVVTLALVGLFFALVAVPQALVLDSTTTGSASGVLLISLATLAAAAVFNPLRRRVQAGVDRRFARTRFDRGRVVAEFQDRLREPRDLPSLVGDVTAVIDRTLAPSRVGVWTRRGVQ